VEVLEAKSERSRVTQEALLDAFVDLLGERPYAQIGVAQIAARAGLTTGAIYGRFGSKQGVVLALHTRFVEHWIGTMEIWAAQPRWSSASSQEIISSWTRGAVNFSRTYRPLLDAVMQDPAMRDRYEESVRRASAILVRLLADASAKESGNAIRADDVAWAARAAVAILERFDPYDSTLESRIDDLICRLSGVE
jgi:AcrR family transcriptional regulator